MRRTWLIANWQSTGASGYKHFLETKAELPPTASPTPRALRYHIEGIADGRVGGEQLADIESRLQVPKHPGLLMDEVFDDKFFDKLSGFPYDWTRGVERKRRYRRR